MSLEHAILGFLNYRPLTGYDLKKIIDGSVQHFWPADQSQIYRTLSRLEENGFAEKKIVHQEDRPDRKVYRITEEGTQELKKWLKTPLPFGEHRSAPLIQVFFAGQLSDEEVLKIFQRAARFIRAGLERYEQIPEDMEAYTDYVDSPREFYFWMLTLEAGKVTARANLAWMESVMERIKAGEIPQE